MIGYESGKTITFKDLVDDLITKEGIASVWECELFNRIHQKLKLEGLSNEKSVFKAGQKSKKK